MYIKNAVEQYRLIQALREADEEEEEDADGHPEVIEQKGEEAVDPPNPETGAPTEEEIPLTDEKNVPIADGQIPQSSSGIASGEFDALNPQGDVDVLAFKQGNLASLKTMHQDLASKSQLVTNTIVPLIEKALIELLGTSNMYNRNTANVQVSVDDGVKISGTIVYSVAAWIGLEVEQADIAHDSQYVYDTLKVLQNVQFTATKIDCKEGTLVVSFNL